MKKKFSVLLFISMVIGVLYLWYSAEYWGGVNGGDTSSTSALGGALATAIVTPHLTATGIAVFFNALGFFFKSRSFALVAAILYTVALVLFPTYFMFVVVEMILCYIAYARMKQNETASAT